MRAGASIKHEFRLAKNDTMIQVSAERFAAVDADEYKHFTIAPLSPSFHLSPLCVLVRASMCVLLRACVSTHMMVERGLVFGIFQGLSV